jgi:hypothetical protein
MNKNIIHYISVLNDIKNIIYMYAHLYTHIFLIDTIKKIQFKS